MAKPLSPAARAALEEVRSSTPAQSSRQKPTELSPAATTALKELNTSSEDANTSRQKREEDFDKTQKELLVKIIKAEEAIAARSQPTPLLGEWENYTPPPSRETVKTPQPGNTALKHDRK